MKRSSRSSSRLCKAGLSNRKRKKPTAKGLTWSSIAPWILKPESHWSSIAPWITNPDPPQDPNQDPSSDRWVNGKKVVAAGAVTGAVAWHLWQLYQQYLQAQQLGSDWSGGSSDRPFGLMPGSSVADGDSTSWESFLGGFGGGSSSGHTPILGGYPGGGSSSVGDSSGTPSWADTWPSSGSSSSSSWGPTYPTNPLEPSTGSGGSGYGSEFTASSQGSYPFLPRVIDFPPSPGPYDEPYVSPTWSQLMEAADNAMSSPGFGMS